MKRRKKKKRVQDRQQSARLMVLRSGSIGLRVQCRIVKPDKESVGCGTVSVAMSRIKWPISR